MITSYIWKREKFPHSDWLREMQFSGKIIPRRSNQFSSCIYDKQFSRNKRKEYQKIITCLNRVALTKCSLVFWEFIWIISALFCFYILIVRCFLIFFPMKNIWISIKRIKLDLPYRLVQFSRLFRKFLLPIYSILH